MNLLAAVAAYNLFMKEVDIFDHMKANNSILRRERRVPLSILYLS